MACNKQYQKSAIKTYNNITQTVTTDITPLALLGNQCTDCGCSISVNQNNIQIEKTGLYYIGADVTFTPTAAGTTIIQLYKDGVALPCAIAQDTSETGNIFSTHIETVLEFVSCPAVKPKISVNISGTEGGVNSVSVTAYRLA